MTTKPSPNPLVEAARCFLAHHDAVVAMCADPRRVTSARLEAIQAESMRLMDQLRLAMKAAGGVPIDVRLLTGEPSSMPPALRTALEEEGKRAMVAFIEITKRWPNYRQTVAFSLLGGAVANVDMMGGSVEAWLAHLRVHEPRPEPIDAEAIARTAGN